MANNICIIKLGRIKSLERRDNMFFWKIDDETIRCLINKEEIGQMGFDLKELGEDNEQMEELLNALSQILRIILNGIQRMGCRIILPEHCHPNSS